MASLQGLNPPVPLKIVIIKKSSWTSYLTGIVNMISRREKPMVPNEIRNELVFTILAQ